MADRSAGTVRPVERNLTAYRVLATLVGVLMIPLFTAWGLVLFAEGDLHARADGLTNVLGPLHGALYMLFFVSAVLLAFRHRWEIPFTLVTLVCGTVPILSFWAEHRATRRVRAEHAAELV